MYRKAIRVSVGAALVVPFARGDAPEELLRGLDRAGFEILALTPHGQETCHDLCWPDRVALVVGSEGAGLPKVVLSRSRTVRIAMEPGFDSLNLATASGIALHAARRGGAARRREAD